MIYALFIYIGCKTDMKVPILTADIVEKIVLPDCTHNFIINTSLGYDPIILEQIKTLTIFVRRTGSLMSTTQSYHNPYNTVSYS